MNKGRAQDPEHIKKTTGEAPRELPTAEAEQGKSTPESREESIPEREKEQGKKEKGTNIDP